MLSKAVGIGKLAERKFGDWPGGKAAPAPPAERPENGFGGEMLEERPVGVGANIEEPTKELDGWNDEVGENDEYDVDVAWYCRGSVELVVAPWIEMRSLYVELVSAAC